MSVPANEDPAAPGSPAGAGPPRGSAGRLALAPLALAHRLFPAGMQTGALCAALGRLLETQGLAERLVPLEGRAVWIDIHDVPIVWRLEVEAGRVRPQRSPTHWDVRVRGRLRDFALLAARIEDADTLFFARRLVVEGDTEAGLVVKNLLDAVELDRETALAALIGVERAEPIAERLRGTLPDRALDAASRAARRLLERFAGR